MGTSDAIDHGARIVAIIPARGGSKGVPGKNLRPVGGIPLVARAVGSALATRRIDAVYVSTDDSDIAAVARQAGAEVIIRPADLSVDTASSESALLHALDALETAPQVVVFIQATSPFIDPADLDSAIARVDVGESDVVFAARPTHAFLWRQGKGGATGINHDHSFRQRRQDVEPQFQETGAFYVMRAAGFREAGFRFFGRIDLAVVPELSSIEIDTIDDLAVATAIAGNLPTDAAIDVDGLVTDFDGVHTDDRVHVGPDGTEFVTASRSDGMGIALLRRVGLPLLIISAETNPVVSARARKLKVDVRQGVEDKVTVLRSWADARDLDLQRVAFLGNDVNDLGCLRAVGWPIAVADAHPDVIAVARVVLSARGGHGAVRELANRILASHHSQSTQEDTWSRSVPTQ